MSAPKCSTFNSRPTFVNPMYFKKAQSKKPCLYEIPYDTSDPANRFVPDREETLTLEKESRLILNKDLVKPYDYTKQNSLYENFKLATQEYHDQLAHANGVRKKMWRKYFVKSKPKFVSLTFSEAGVLLVNWISFGHCVSRRGSKDQEPCCFGGDSDVEGVPENLFQEDGQGDNNIEEASMDKNEDKSEDPFNIYHMLNNKTEMVRNNNKSDGSLKYPPGFTPIESTDVNSLHVDGDSNDNVEGLNECNGNEVSKVSRGSRLNTKSKDDGADSIFSGHFKKSEIPRTGAQF
ncbi:hypothetical protein Tco_1001103 [Tanacetum coccineum]